MESDSINIAALFASEEITETQSTIARLPWESKASAFAAFVGSLMMKDY
jgi:hypothetical protein